MNNYRFPLLNSFNSVSIPQSISPWAGSLVLKMNDSFFLKDEDENHVLVTRKEIQDLYTSILELTYNNKNANNAGILNIIVHSEVKLNDKGEPIE